jgi:hypothetical protein
MTIAIDPEEGFLEEIFAFLHVTKEPIDVVRKGIFISADENIKGLDSSSLKLGHQVLITHLQQHLVMLLIEFAAHVFLINSRPAGRLRCCQYFNSTTVTTECLRL